MFRRSALEMRVLVLAPIGRDARLLASTIAALQIDTAIADDAAALLPMVAEGAGAVIIAQEALTQNFARAVGVWLDSQPAWSAIPFLVLTSGGRPTYESRLRAQELQALGNFTLIERPVRPDTVQSLVRAALRARMRQYEIRSQQEALIQANADLEQFAYSASHDLREPLRSIGIYGDLFARSQGTLIDESGRRYLDFIQLGIQRMDALLTDLLTYAHASSISEGTVEPVQALGPLEAALQSLAGAIHESNAQISLGDMPAVRVHESHLSQIFQNLIGNAIKYRKENQPLQIQVSAERSGTHWVFRIADNGIGVPPHYRETIFGIFKRLHTTGKYSGTGMGLAICQRIIERYRGRIWVESGSGDGSEFVFTLPS
jgi:signal transduction histidine kinase